MNAPVKGPKQSLSWLTPLVVSFALLAACGEEPESTAITSSRASPNRGDAGVPFMDAALGDVRPGPGQNAHRMPSLARRPVPAPGRSKTFKHGPAPKTLLSPTTLAKPAPPRFRARFRTSRGDFVVEVVRERAPYAADRFFNLVKAGYFSGNRFWNVERGTRAEFGVHGHPAVAGVWGRARLLDDLVPTPNRRGTLSFVAFGPMTRTTRIQINLRDNPALDSRKVIPFGTIVEGIEVADGLYAGYGAAAGRGDDGVRLERVLTQGNAYLAANFPELDWIRDARLEPAAASPRKSRRR